MSTFQVTGLPTIPAFSNAASVTVSNLPSIPVFSNAASVSVSNLPSIPTVSNAVSVTSTDNTGTTQGSSMWIFWVGIVVLLITAYLMTQKKGK